MAEVGAEINRQCPQANGAKPDKTRRMGKNPDGGGAAG